VKIFGLPVGADGCGYYRCYQPLAELRRRGHNVMLPERGMVWLPDAELNAGDIDVFAGQLLTGTNRRQARRQHVRQEQVDLFTAFGQPGCVG
jgi:hypothetical protein